MRIERTNKHQETYRIKYQMKQTNKQKQKNKKTYFPIFRPNDLKKEESVKDKAK